MNHDFACHLISSIYAPGFDIGTNKRTPHPTVDVLMHPCLIPSMFTYRAIQEFIREASAATASHTVKYIRRFYGKIPGIWLLVHLPLFCTGVYL